MKKKLLAMAVAGAFAAPVAAMADTTIYGVMDLSYDSVSTGNVAGGTSTSQTKISSNSSRIGFKGTEDLGGGTNAVWQIESLVNADNSANSATGTPTCTQATGGSTAAPAAITCTAVSSTANNGILATRNTFVGLSGDSWGTVLLGRNDTPYKASTRKMDLFYDTIADNRTLMGGVAGKSAAISFDGRQTDMIQYNSPNMGGFAVSVQYDAGAENATTSGNVKGSAWSLAGTYAAGPITAALAYETHDIGNAGTGTMGAAGGGVTNQKERAYKLAGGYAMDQFAVNLVYEKTSDGFSAGTDLYDHHAWYLSGKFNVSSSDAVKLAYTNAGNIHSVSNTSAKQISLGYDHGMSKRTTVYALYTKLTNDSAIAYNLSAAAVSTGTVAVPGNGADPSAFAVGIRHTF